jgi:hypothetical protein
MGIVRNGGSHYLIHVSNEYVCHLVRLGLAVHQEYAAPPIK